MPRRRADWIQGTFEIVLLAAVAVSAAFSFMSWLTVKDSTIMIDNKNSARMYHSMSTQLHQCVQAMKMMHSERDRCIEFLETSGVENIEAVYTGGGD